MIAPMPTMAAPESIASGSRRVLIAGSGPDADPGMAWHQEWQRQGYKLTRLDIEPSTNPDILASMVDMGDIGTFEAIFCCHALEHLYPHEVPRALKEFYRVLEPGGCVIIFVPDLEDVAPTEDAITIWGTMKICGLHLYYGDAAQIEAYPYMAHHCGFVEKTLRGTLEKAGFSRVETKRHPSFNLAATGHKA
jgi:SAM-dependent methyltransferase